MCYFIELIIFCAFSLAMFFKRVGVSVTKGNQTIFWPIPYYVNSIDLQHSKTIQQHQDNTKITPRASHRASNSKTERGQSSHTDVARTRLYDKTDIYDNIVYFLYNFFRHLPKNLKTAKSAILFTIPKEIQTAPTPLMLEHWNSDTDNTKYVLLMEITQIVCYYALQITQYMCYLLLMERKTSHDRVKSHSTSKRYRESLK